MLVKVFPYRVVVVLFLAVTSLPTYGQWVTFTNQTATRLVANPAVGAADIEEKDYAWADLDKDGDVDLVCVRKQPFTSAGRKTSVLFMNEGIAEGHPINGVMVDRTAQWATDATDGGQGFLDLTNNRDVVIVDLNNDTWLDVVTATTLSDGLPKTISHPRIYINKAAVAGVWQGLRYEEARIPQIFTIPGGVAVAPRYCSVAAGDVTGDGYPDLYFGDYDSSGAGGGQEPAGIDVNDRLLTNNGSGFFTDSLQTRMTAEMLLSAFSVAAKMVDMNNDGRIDVIKDTALNPPQRISVSYNNPANPGFFNAFDVVATNAPYHIDVGDLNQDNKPDIIVSDDGQDFYMLNQGNGTDGLANFIEFPFNADDGFGGNNHIADLNKDGLPDAVIADVDVDIGGCGRRLHIYRNLGNLPNVTMQEQGGQQPWMPDGTFEVGIVDINRDTWPDMFIGTCQGTEIWINQPPAGLQFTYQNGLPAFVPPSGALTFPITVTGIGSAVPQPGTGVLHVSVNGGTFSSVPMTPTGPNQYNATFPSGTCTDEYRFYVTALAVGGGTFSDPPGAPASNYLAYVAVGTSITLRDEIEGDVSGWTVSAHASLTSGAWEAVNPNGTLFNGDQAAPEDDATAATNKVKAFITENGSVNGAAGQSDIDNGPAYLMSPVIDLTGVDATISYARWFHCSDEGFPNADFMTVEVSNNNGGSWVPVETIAGTNSSWLQHTFRVSDLVPPTATIRVRFSADDVPNNSITEAGVDNFQVEVLVCTNCQTPADCSDGNPCTADQCNAGLCSNPPAAGPCDDTNACTTNDACSGGLCGGTPISGCTSCQTPAECNDGNGCTNDACTGGVCVFTPHFDPCDDGEPCTENDACASGVCSGTFIPGCAQCTTDPECDDGVFCNGVEVCVGLSCASGDYPCGNDACDENIDACVTVLQPRMGDPVRGLSAAQLLRFDAGLAEFNRNFGETDGLGPIFNQNSCSSCHNAGGIGGAGTIFVTRFGRVDKDGFDPLAAIGGSLLQSQSIGTNCGEVIPPQASVTANRITPALFGGGLVEAIADADLSANATNPPAGVSGDAHMVPAFEDPAMSPLRVGRFGWKSQVATLLTFSSDASLNEMGLTNRFLPQENAPNGDMVRLSQCDTMPDPEDGPDGQGFHFIDRVSDFQRFLAAPPQTPRSGMAGEVLFNNIGCNACHVASFDSGTAPEAALSNKLVKPYSDFLVHDMGLLGDGIVQGDADEREIRTASLWGIRARNALLHDGRVLGGTLATRIVAAVGWHNVLGSEAQSSAESFTALSPADQARIVAFMDSLGRAEFDHDGDNDVQLDDFQTFAGCYASVGPYTADVACAISDVNQDGVVDDADFDLFLQAYDGALTDCNNNAEVDLRDILDNPAMDTNLDGVLDICEAPSLAAPPHNRPKNRYVSFAPTAGVGAVAYRVDKTTLPVGTCWVGVPDAGGRARCNAAPVVRIWNESVVHIGDCKIVPVATYEIRRTSDQVIFSTPLTVNTAGQPQGKFWGDVVGQFIGTEWTAPNGFANVNDVFALVARINGATNAATFETCNVQAVSSDDPCLNAFVNVGDVFAIVRAVAGNTYPFTANPATCPVCP